MYKDGEERCFAVNKGTEQSLRKVEVAVPTDLLATQERHFSKQTLLYQRHNKFVAVEFRYSAMQIAGLTA